jgi:hypothetical protein
VALISVVTHSAVDVSGLLLGPVVLGACALALHSSRSEFAKYPQGDGNMSGLGRAVLVLMAIGSLIMSRLASSDTAQVPRQSKENFERAFREGCAKKLNNKEVCGCMAREVVSRCTLDELVSAGKYENTDLPAWHPVHKAAEAAIEKCAN